MSNLDTRISNGMVIPSVKGAEYVFGRTRGPALAVGLIAVGHEIMPGAEPIHDAYMMLRGRVYHAQTRMIKADRVVQDGPQAGAELPDGDDGRAFHFGMLERTEEEKIRLVGIERHISKSEETPEPLPIELFFPGAFKRGKSPAPHRSVEVSRFVLRHEDPMVQKMLAGPQFGFTLTHALASGSRTAYGVVEPKIRDRLIEIGVPLQEIAKPKMVREYGAPNLAFSIDLTEMANRFRIDPKDLEDMNRSGGRFMVIPHPAKIRAIRAAQKTN